VGYKLKRKVVISWYIPPRPVHSSVTH